MWDDVVSQHVVYTVFYIQLSFVQLLRPCTGSRESSSCWGSVSHCWKLKHEAFFGSTVTPRSLLLIIVCYGFEFSHGLRVLAVALSCSWRVATLISQDVSVRPRCFRVAISTKRIRGGGKILGAKWQRKECAHSCLCTLSSTQAGRKICWKIWRREQINKAHFLWIKHECKWRWG